MGWAKPVEPSKDESQNAEGDHYRHQDDYAGQNLGAKNDLHPAS